jgi:hypothetical protein
MRKFYSMITFMLLLGVTGLSQTIRLTGQVKDITGEPVPFATIIVKATNNTAAADQNGNN